MRRPLRAAILTCALLSGCSAQPPITRDALAGTYIYKSQDPGGKPTDHAWDSLTLRPDGTYDLVEGGPTKPRPEKTGRWHYTVERDAQVLLDSAGFPVRVSGDETRLMIDYDVGIWYAKVK